MTNSKIEYHKVVDILIFNNDQKLALQLRAVNDKSYPDHWDFSAGGHIDKDESDEAAAKREIFEELGVRGNLTFISQEHFQYPSWNSSIMREVDAAIYVMKHNGPFKINPNEVQKVSFFSLPAIQEMVDNGEKIHPEFLLTWKKGIVTKGTKKL